MDKDRTQVFPAEYESLAAIDRFVSDAAEEAGFDNDAVYQVRLAVDEACSNIINHAYGGEGRGEIECSCRAQDDDLTVILRDQGAPFDPDSVPPPDLSDDLEERSGGGLGLYFIRELMDEVDFDFRADAGNVLKLVKRKQDAGREATEGQPTARVPQPERPADQAC
ncbi:MAG: ATP-binding protein [Anaerolineae bacterium]|jgi:serine/threonine-protein kinase RsbW